MKENEDSGELFLCKETGAKQRHGNLEKETGLGVPQPHRKARVGLIPLLLYALQCLSITDSVWELTTKL